MAQFDLEEILKAANGTLLSGSGSGIYPAISIDSRTIGKGELFIAIKGKNFDGHDFVLQALRRGAGGAIISDKKLKEKIGDKPRHNIILVKDTLKALHDIANHHRKKFNIPVIGITGSNGKSTSKEMSASVASVRLNILKNEGNLNNQIGLPLTLLKMNDSHQAAILEMGMNERGEIEKLSRIAEPTVGLITNIGKAHLENLGSMENIRDAKGELIRTIGENGTAILNSDDPLAAELKNGFKGRVITFGINSPSEITAFDIKKDKDSGYRFTLKMDGRDTAVNLSYPGYHNIYNAISAAAVGKSLGIAIDDIKKGIESFKPLPMRMERFVIDDGIIIINDAYNANPSSMEAAIKTLSETISSGKKFLVIGDMLELGGASEDAHRYIGRLVASLFLQGQGRRTIDYLITLGEQSRFAFYEAVRSGMPRDRAYCAENSDEAAFILDDELESGDCVMIKGSRGMKMENVVERIIGIRRQKSEDRSQKTKDKVQDEEDVCLLSSVF
ncbi:MAG: UDP-N-acetylmuramoyl-tripeptide--D-alanyl-D-alanine ligase [Nitrospinae bacterium]|nr:UDP-N-acetylmuramoyl-tripeptide--D-alanyl-D-alanine ligase [Nitrospinota bacterium]